MVFFGSFTIVILTQYTYCGFDTIQRVLDMTPKVVGAAAAGSGANLENMASPGLTQIKWGQRWGRPTRVGPNCALVPYY